MEGYILQSVVFDSNYWTSKQALKFLKKHNIKPLKRVHKINNNLRYRINEPNARYKYITKKLNDGISLVFYKK